MNREQFRKDIAVLLREHDLDIHKMSWSEDLIKRTYSVSIQADGTMDEQASFEFTELEPEPE